MAPIAAGWTIHSGPSITRLYTLEAKKVLKGLSCSAILTVGELHGCGLAALAHEIKYFIWSGIHIISKTKTSHYT